MAKIRKVTVFSQWQPFRDGTYTCSGGRSAEGFDSTIVRIESDRGHVGWGEMAPLGAFYDPSFTAGARAAIAELAPRLVGAEADAIDVLNRKMDFWLKGHPYSKSALDMALWDLRGQATGQSLANLAGGAETTSLRLYRSISQDMPGAMAQRAAKYAREGYRRLQVKVGLDVDEDVERLQAVRAAVPSSMILFCDANGSWTTSEARRFLGATRNIDYVFEQPCASYGENLALRGACGHRPFVLDESIDSLEVLLKAIRDGL